MKRHDSILSLTLAAAGAFCTSTTALPQNIQWERITEVEEDSKIISKEPDVEVFSGPSYIMVNLSKPMKIEIFTILGRLVSSESLASGSYRINLKAHGVYIVKTGEATFKIVI